MSQNPPHKLKPRRGLARLEPDFPSYEGMSRRLRYVPEGGALVEVTCRTVHSRFLLRPSLALNEIVLGVLARARSLKSPGTLLGVSLGRKRGGHGVSESLAERERPGSPHSLWN
jgi:hypothetical protein